jgi:hypothetical protein
MTVGAGHGGGYLNFAATVHGMPEYPWQCLNFLGTGHDTSARKGQRLACRHLALSDISNFIRF